MNLVSKTISVGNRSINSKITREQVEDLKNLYKSFRYKIENESEKLILQKYFNVKFIKEDFVHYSIPRKQEIRRFKLLILKKDDLAEIIQRILDNSELVNDPSIQDMETILVNEISQSINKEIISKLMNMSNFKYGK